MTTVHTLFVVSTVMQWHPFQINAKNAFPNGLISEEISMKHPPTLRHSSGYVYHLCRALYGLKQAPRAWVTRFNDAI